MGKLIGYARVSTKQQATDRQEVDLLAAGVRRDDLYVDHGVSGARVSRPEFDRALAAIQDGDGASGGLRALSKNAPVDRRRAKRGKPFPPRRKETGMSKFVLLYEGGSMPQTPEDGEKVRDAWMAWFAKAGGAILDPGNAFAESTAVGATLPDSGVNGYTLVEGDSLAGVTAMIGDHPHLAAGGRIEVHATAEM